MREANAEKRCFHQTHAALFVTISGCLSAGNRRDQHYFVAILKGITLAPQKADVLVVHVDVDEAPQLTGLILDLGRKRREIAVNVLDQRGQVRRLR